MKTHKDAVRLVIAPFGEGATLPSSDRLWDPEMDIRWMSGFGEFSFQFLEWMSSIWVFSLLFLEQFTVMRPGVVEIGTLRL